MAAQYRLRQVAVPRLNFFDPFFVFKEGQENPSGIGYHFKGYSWDQSVYKAVMPISEAYHPTASDHLRPFDSLGGEISKVQGEKDLLTNGSQIFKISNNLSSFISETVIPSGLENAQRLLNENFVDVTLVNYHPTFTIYGPDFEIFKTISFVNPSPSHTTMVAISKITPLNDGGFIAGQHQFSAAGEYVDWSMGQ